MVYVPDSAVDHHIAADRTTRDYYRRWYQGLGRAWVIFQRPSRLRRLPLFFRALRGVLRWSVRERRLRKRGDLERSLHALGKRESYRGRLLELTGLSAYDRLLPPLAKPFHAQEPDSAKLDTPRSVALFRGCVSPHLEADVLYSAAAVLDRLGARWLRRRIHRSG